MNPAEEGSSAVAAIVHLQLAAFGGLARGTTRAQIIAEVGPVYAEGFGGGAIPLWMTVHEITPEVRLTAWYVLAGDGLDVTVGPSHPVAWIERPIIPSEVADLLKLPGGHRPPGAGHLLAWPKRGIGLYFSRRSQLPTLLLAYVPMSDAEFDKSPMAMRG